MTGTQIRHIRPILAAGMIVFLALAAGGCGSVIPGAVSVPPRLYQLTPKSTYSKNLPKVGWQLIVETPVAAASLNTNRIAVRRDAITLGYYERAVWTDVAPRLVQTLMIESFENTGKIIAVGRESVGLRSDFILKTELREFQAETESGSPVVHVRVIAKLVQMPQRTIIAWTSEEYKIPADGESMNAIVGAFDEALGKTLKRIVEWTLKTAPRDASPRKRRRRS
jgi:cholesterol transport system auxiliary component